MIQTIKQKEFIYANGEKYCFDVFEEECQVAYDYTRYYIDIYHIVETQTRHWFWRGKIINKVEYNKINKHHEISDLHLKKLSTKALVVELQKMIDSYLSKKLLFNTELQRGFDEHFDGFIGMNDEQKRIKAIEQIIK